MGKNNQIHEWATILRHLFFLPFSEPFLKFNLALWDCDMGKYVGSWLKPFSEVFQFLDLFVSSIADIKVNLNIRSPYSHFIRPIRLDISVGFIQSSGQVIVWHSTEFVPACLHIYMRVLALLTSFSVFLWNYMNNFNETSSQVLYGLVQLRFIVTDQMYRRW